MALDKATQVNLVTAATQAIDKAQVQPNKNHRVAAACLTTDGRIISGVNVAHYTGGPCAEPVAIGAAVALGYMPHHLTHMVAVGHNGRDIHVLIRDGAEVKEVSVVELLPFPYKLEKDFPVSAVQPTEEV